MKYVKRLEEKSGSTSKKQPVQKDAAAELYENLCMNAVNQSIGMSCLLIYVMRCTLTSFSMQDEPFDIEVTGHLWSSWIVDMRPQSRISYQNGLAAG